MARYRKGTNDADGDGKKGGSLKAGSRFVKGTTDHDADGKMGGSLPKGDSMAKGTKKAAKPKRAVPPQPQVEGDDVPARKQAVAEQFSEADAIAEATLGRQMRGW
jgi:hypothetical protein